jgi:hypothetical protein
VWLSQRVASWLTTRKMPPMIATQIALLTAARITTTAAVVREPHTYPPGALGRRATVMR